MWSFTFGEEYKSVQVFKWSMQRMDNEIKEVTIGCACNLGIHAELGGDTQARWLVGWSGGDWIDLRCTGVKNGRLFETLYICNVENLGSISLSSQILWYDYLSAGVLCSSV